MRKRSRKKPAKYFNQIARSIAVLSHVLARIVAAWPKVARIG
jgi:hypothetical protein